MSFDYDFFLYSSFQSLFSSVYSIFWVKICESLSSLSSLSTCSIYFCISWLTSPCLSLCQSKISAWQIYSRSITSHPSTLSSLAAGHTLSHKFLFSEKQIRAYVIPWPDAMQSKAISFMGNLYAKAQRGSCIWEVKQNDSYSPTQISCFATLFCLIFPPLYFTLTSRILSEETTTLKFLTKIMLK